MDIAYVRKYIDRLDSMIISLLAKRADLVAVAASLKKSGQSIRDPRRVEPEIVNVREKATQTGLDPDIAGKTYRP